MNCHEVLWRGSRVVQWNTDYMCSIWQSGSYKLGKWAKNTINWALTDHGAANAAEALGITSSLTPPLMHIIKLLQTWLIETEGNMGGVLSCLSEGGLRSLSAPSSTVIQLWKQPHTIVVIASALSGKDHILTTNYKRSYQSAETALRQIAVLWRNTSVCSLSWLIWVSRDLSEKGIEWNEIWSKQEQLLHFWG